MRIPFRFPAWTNARGRWLIIGIIGLAFLLRIAGIGYGLPLWLVADEPSLIFGALKMIELKTLIPSLHASTFAGTFYYGAYLPYVYLLPFLAAMGLAFVSFPGSFVVFKAFLVSDVSIFFLIARTISAALGALTVYVAYRAARELFGSDRPALAAAAFLATSLLHVDFSHWGRHWIPVTLCFTFAIFFLAHREWPIGRRAIRASLAAGVGVGISIQAGLAALFIAAWLLCVDRVKPFTLLKERWFWLSVSGFFGCVLLAFLLWTKSFDFLFANGTVEVVHAPKTVIGLLLYYVYHGRNLLTAEPVFFVSILLGGIFLFRRRRPVFIAMAVFIAMYFAIFYVFFSRFDRYILMLYPLFAIMAGYGVAGIFEWLAVRSRFFARAFVGTIIFLMLASAILFDIRLLRNDTRIQARNWILSNIPIGARVATLVPLFRIPMTGEAVDEQHGIDPKSIRSADAAERELPEALLPQRFHALNLNSVHSPEFFRQLPSYLREHGYAYLVMTPEALQEKGAPPETAELGDVLVSFSGFRPANANGSLTEGFGDGLRELVSPKLMGPDIIIRALR